MAGITADANILINYARLSAQRYSLSYQEPIPVEQLVQKICDLKQGYTQYGGLRPFGVSFIYAGWDRNYGFQLYQSDPSGNYGAWKATCIGANNQVRLNSFLLFSFFFFPFFSFDSLTLILLLLLLLTLLLFFIIIIIIRLHSRF